MIALRNYARFAATNKSMIASLQWVSYFLVQSLRSALHVSRWSAAIAADTTGQLSGLAVMVGFSLGVGSVQLAGSPTCYCTTNVLKCSLGILRRDFLENVVRLASLEPDAGIGAK